MPFLPRPKHLAAALGLLACAEASAQAPTIQSVIPNYASHVLTISGANFGATPTVTFAGSSLSPSIVTPGTKMTVSVPSGLAPANYALVVGNGSGSATFNLYYGPAAMTWKGAWSSSATYSYNDSVSYNGGSYLSRSNGNMNHQPDIDTNWTILAQPPAHQITSISLAGTDTGTVKAVGINYIIALGGIFPSGGGASGSANYNEQIIGEIRMFAGTFEPAGWAYCDGRLLQISTNSALFNLIGTTYGGDGMTTFALPDLRGAVPMHLKP
jgi:microcystin-dependent protein